MTYLTKCEPCKRGDHDHHERQVDPLTPEQIEAGVLGGGVCVCDCTKLRPLGGNHALLCGMVLGALMAHRTGDFEVEPEMDGNDYTGRTLIKRPSGTWAATVIIEPVEVHEL